MNESKGGGWNRRLSNADTTDEFAAVAAASTHFDGLLDKLESAADAYEQTTVEHAMAGGVRSSHAKERRGSFVGSTDFGNQSTTLESFDDADVAAITKLQAVHRGRKARRDVKEKQDEREMIEQATKIQANYRRFVAQRNFKEMKRASSSSSSSSSSSHSSSSSSASDLALMAAEITPADEERVTRMQARLRGNRTRKELNLNRQPTSGSSGQPIDMDEFDHDDAEESARAARLRPLNIKIGMRKLQRCDGQGGPVDPVVHFFTRSGDEQAFRRSGHTETAVATAQPDFERSLRVLYDPDVEYQVKLKAQDVQFVGDKGDVGDAPLTPKDSLGSASFSIQKLLQIVETTKKNRVGYKLLDAKRQQIGAAICILTVHFED
jgi:hypothetical protein